MKKLSAILLILVMLFAFTACGKGSSETTEYTSSYEIDWSQLADSDIVGAWKPAEPVADEYVLFTPDAKLRIVNGTFITESSIQFGTDGAGNKSAYTQIDYLYGQWTYTVKDGVLTVIYPQYEDGSDIPASYVNKVFNSMEYTPITLKADEDFTSDDALVGKWTNEAYSDSYEFTEDGYVIYNQAVDNGIHIYDAEIKMTYNFDADGKLVCNFYEDNSGVMVSDSVEYSIDGTKLLVAGSDYYLNGEGDPGVTEAAE